MLAFILSLPLVGAILAALCNTTWSLRLSLGTLLLFLLSSAAALLLPTDSVAADVLFALDPVAAPLLPVFGLLHLLCLLGTAKKIINRSYCVRCLLAAGLSALALTCHNPQVLLLLLIASVLLPWWELRDRGRPARVFFLYMLVFVVLVIAAMLTGVTEQQPLGVGLLLLAILIRGGLVPAHSWLPSLFSGASYGTSMLFVLPLLEILVVVRVLLTAIPEWMLEATGLLCLITAVYGGGLAMVQTQVSKFFSYLCLSQTSLVLYAVLLHTAIGVTAALCLWMSTAITLSGLAFSIRALESRFGPMSLAQYHGHYEQVPGLAALFLITGLASVGFPGTMGFVPMELLFSSSYEKGLGVSGTLAAAAMLNGIAMLRAYFALFTGHKPQTSISLSVTWRERVGIVLITLVVFGGAWLTPSVVESRHQTAAQLLGLPVSDNQRH
jgi:NADH-quinone oxidoreductase subunit M